MSRPGVRLSRIVSPSASPVGLHHDPRVKSGVPNLHAVTVTSPGTRQQPPGIHELMLLGLSIASRAHSKPDVPTGSLEEDVIWQV